MGFEYFYGFVGGDTSQWEPNLFRNTTQIYPYVGQPPGTWNLTTAMADDAIKWMNDINQIDPSKPFFCYYVPGGTHAPHHPTKKWVDKIHDMHLFDEGWNKLRDTIFANEKRLGVIPKDAKMTPWPHDLIKNWDELTSLPLNSACSGIPLSPILGTAARLIIIWRKFVSTAAGVFRRHKIRRSWKTGFATRVRKRRTRRTPCLIPRASDCGACGWNCRRKANSSRRNASL
jgi:Sulfatase